MKSVYSVSKISSYIRGMFTQDYLLRSLTVQGEISNCKYHSSGHIYFTLKDDAAAIACVMFRGSRDKGGLAFKLENGQQVQVTGSIDVYERDGRYQLYASQIRLAGIGQLYERYEALKARLSELGMFAPEYKQPIPKYIHTLGVVTAPTGAAVRDIISITKRRNPYVQILLYPAIVQGDQAAASIIRGIEVLTAKHPDVIIVGRGGGSIEDLWAFNEEPVVEAVFNCPIPIISAVGHETDTTLTDYAADMRAATPSAAAELAVFEVGRLQQDLQDYHRLLDGRMQQAILRKRQQVQALERALRLCSPEQKTRQLRMRSVQLEEHLQHAMEQKIAETRRKAEWGRLLQSQMDQLLREYRHRQELDLQRLQALSPAARLSSGYAFVAGADGRPVRSIGDTAVGAGLSVHLRDGKLETTVSKIERKS